MARDIGQTLREDAKRRNARKATEDALLDKIRNGASDGAPDGIDPYLWSRSITGAPSQANRDYKATQDCWKRGLRSSRTVGSAGGDDPALNTVAVTRPGFETIVVPVPRKGRTLTRKRTTTTIHNQRAHLHSSALPAIGNVE